MTTSIKTDILAVCWSEAFREENSRPGMPRRKDIGNALSEDNLKFAILLYKEDYSQVA